MMTEMEIPFETPALRIIGIPGIPEIKKGDNLADIVMSHFELYENDVLVITQKMVSKAEGRLVTLDPDRPAEIQIEELILSESRRVLRRRGKMLITETHFGYVCANAGIDESNVPEGTVALLPRDPDRSARRIRDRIVAKASKDVGVIVSDTFGRTWRQGVTDVAIGVAGIAAVVDLRGTKDALGRELQVTQVALADELAGAAELVKPKGAGMGVAVIRGVEPAYFRESSAAAELIRPYSEDLFR